MANGKMSNHSKSFRPGNSNLALNQALPTPNKVVSIVQLRAKYNELWIYPGSKYCAMCLQDSPGPSNNFTKMKIAGVPTSSVTNSVVPEEREKSRLFLRRYRFKGMRTRECIYLCCVKVVYNTAER